MYQQPRTGVVRFQKHQRIQIKDWVGRLKDIPAFIIGNGPSLRNVDISLLRDYFTIGINRAHYLIDPTILMYQDISLWNTEYKHIHNLQALKVARDIADPRRIYYNFYLKGGQYKFDPTKSHILYGSGSTGVLAIELAVAMGCKPIVLLGCDCKPAVDGSTDFYGNNKFHLPHTMDNCKKGLEFVKNNCPTEIKSCSDNDFFVKESLDSILEILDNPLGRQAYVKLLKGTR